MASLQLLLNKRGIARDAALLAPGYHSTPVVR
jgi:hypothetical protein